MPKLHSLLILKHMISKHLQKAFTKWQIISTFLQKPNRLPTQCKTTPPLSSKKRISKLTIATKITKSNQKTVSKSPIETGRRLFTHAKEIQAKKNIMKEAYTPEYSFTPTIKGFTGKWLQIKQSLKKTPITEEIAVVSARAFKVIPDDKFSRSLTPFF